MFEGIGCAADKADPADTVGAAGAVDAAHLVIISNAYGLSSILELSYHHGLVRQNVFLFLLGGYLLHI